MAEMENSEKDHVKRLRGRFADASARDGLSDAELLVLLLSYTRVESPLEQLAEALIDSFGSLRGCLFAPFSDLMRIEGMTQSAAVLLLLTGVAAVIDDEEDPVGRCVSEFTSLFLSILSTSRTEELWAAALDETGRIISVERLAEGSDGTVSVRIAEILRFITYHNCKRLVIAHSHPTSTDTNASPLDISSMEHIGDAMDGVGGMLYGQVIVAGNTARFVPHDRSMEGYGISISKAESMP